MSPSPVVDGDARRLISTLAIKAAKAVGYSNAGTVEFLRDSETDNFYFMEINSRLQVEHPVTELVTGIDIVATQIRIASENKLPFRQRDVKFHGCAIECRINAEDPFLDFAPTTGKIEFLNLPGGPGIRVDTALQQGIEISPYYDSLVAKLIAAGRNFEESRKRALQALEELSIVGIKTTIPFHRAVLEDARFSRGEFDTGFVESLGLSERIPTSVDRDYFIIAAVLLSKNQFSTTKESSSEEQVRRPAWLTTKEKGRFIDAI
jgi:acetyl/propionyl-CoA carboxylase alpha subunit